MSLKRLVYYSAIIGGWAAFLGWLLATCSGVKPDRQYHTAWNSALVGGAIGAGLSLVVGMVNAQWKQLLKRALPGFVIGTVSGALGGALGDLLLSRFDSIGGMKYIGSALGWTCLGASIGVVEGLYERSPTKIRNGLIGGAVGGLVGCGLYFALDANLPTRSNLLRIATTFVAVGISIGAFIGLAQVAFKQAWLTVLDGYRPGRQLILTEANAVLGRAEHASMPFMSKADAGDIDLEHARIVRERDGRFALEDNNSRAGVRVNNVRVSGRAYLNDGDTIKIGTNTIQFSTANRRLAPSGLTSGLLTARSRKPATPPPPQLATPAPSPQPRPSAAPPTPTVSPLSPAFGVTLSPLGIQAPFAPPLPRPAPSPRAISTARPPAAPKPTPTPPAHAPAPLPALSPVATTPPRKPAADGACPGCGRQVPRNQRYCIVCDLNF